MNVKRGVEVFLVMIAITVVFCSFVSALATSNAYTNANPFTVYPGETKEVTVSLQTLSEETITAEATLEEGSEIASLVAEEYTLSSANSALPSVKVAIPEGTPIGQEYTVKIRFTEIDPEGGEGGMVGLSISSASVLIPVKVIERPLEEIPPEEGIGTGLIVFLIILIVVIIAIIYLVVKKRGSSAVPVKPVKK